MANRNWILGLLLTATVVLAGACGDDDTPPDACADVSCPALNDYCDGELAIQFTGDGACDADTGDCDYSAVMTQTDCQAENAECVDGACVPLDACAGVTCESPDEAFCDGDTLVTYAATGTCTDGVCDYPETQTDCTTGGQVCVGAACVDPAECTTADDCPAPAATCEADVAVSFSGNGACTATNVCDYTAVRVEDDCAAAGQACEAGACRDLTTAEQIAVVQASLDTTGLTLPVTGAVVTLVKPDIAGDAGFFVQAGPTGPALFVEATGIDPLPAEGDTVSFVVTEVGRFPPASVVATTLTVDATGTDVSGWPQDVTAATDLLTDRASYEAELIAFDATLAGDVGGAGFGYLSAPIDTTGISANTDLELRYPADLQPVLDLEVGCDISVSRAVVWAYSAKAQLSPFYADDVTVSSCPAPVLTSAYASSTTEVTVEFSRLIDAATVDAADFTIEGLTVDAAAADGRQVVLTTSAQTAGQAYTLTVSGALADTLGTAVTVPVTADFSGFQLPEVYFSEYIEGSSSNKALEIHNAGADAADLSACVVNLYSNGASSPNATYALTGVSLPAGEQYVLCEANINALYETACDVKLPYGGEGVVSYNGDDVVELVCSGTPMDVFGQIGVDPGTAWTGGTVSAQNATLRRMCSVTAGDTDGSDAFDPSVEWDAFGTDDFTDLGTYSCP